MCWINENGILKSRSSLLWRKQSANRGPRTNEVEFSRNQASSLIAGALHQIKRKRMYEKQIEQGYGKKSNIDMQIMALEAASVNKDVLDVMRIGSDALKMAVAATYVLLSLLFVPLLS